MSNFITRLMNHDDNGDVIVPLPYRLSHDDNDDVIYHDHSDPLLNEADRILAEAMTRKKRRGNVFCK